MKNKLTLLLLLLVMFATTASAQISSSTTYRVYSGTALPATCDPGPETTDIFIKTTATQGIYYCSATNTWTQAGGGGGTPGGSTMQVQYNNAGAFGGISGLVTNGSTTLTQTSNSATAFESGPNGGTNPVFRLVNSTASAASGISVTGSAAGTAPILASISRTQITTALAGNGLAITADPAIAGSSVAGAAAGGTVTITGGAAARLTSGNGNGGNVVLQPGDAIGSGTAGVVSVNPTGAGSGEIIIGSLGSPGVRTGNSGVHGTTGGSLHFGAANGGAYIGNTSNFGATVVINDTAGLKIRSGVNLGWSSDTSSFGTQDTAWRRLAAASIVQGLANNATPVANLLTIGESSRGGTDSNVAGANGTLQAGLGTGTGGGGSLIFRTAPAGSTGTTANSYTTALTIDPNGHMIVGGTAPTIASGFGTSPSIAGTDQSGRVTVGTGGIATTGAVTFGKAFTTAPSCVVNNETTVLLAQATATTTTLTITSATPFTAADKLTYHCIGY